MTNDCFSWMKMDNDLPVKIHFHSTRPSMTPRTASNLNISILIETIKFWLKGFHCHQVFLFHLQHTSDACAELIVIHI